MRNVTLRAGIFLALVVFCVGCRGRGAAQVQKALSKEAQAAQRAEREAVYKQFEDTAISATADRANDALKDYIKAARVQQPVPRQPPDALERFPYPASSVQPVPGAQPLVDAQADLYAVANNYGGFSFYRSNGSPVGFSALHQSGAFHYFNALGYRIR